MQINPLAPHLGCGLSENQADGDMCTDPPVPAPRHANLYPGLQVPESPNFGASMLDVGGGPMPGGSKESPAERRSVSALDAALAGCGRGGPLIIEVPLSLEVPLHHGWLTTPLPLFGCADVRCLCRICLPRYTSRLSVCRVT